ncbi:ras-related protein Rab-5A-like [Orbicella faveolata]|uniref:ras-related protein Rab-5A-like n=1 Tax=Orbicella faveolata TaxID=48498 RepID=UPI0009E3D3E2|nr:ras-related protein Rab-5A-like [Orbicella faveolata]
MHRAYRVALLGDSAVGKTCLFNRYLKGPVGFSQDTLPTTKVDCGTKKVYQDHGRVVTFSIWDTSGHESFRDFVKGYCRYTDAAIIVYDITQQDSLRNAREWFDILRRDSRPNIFKALAGNKADLVNERQLTFEVICVCSHKFMSGIKSAVTLSNPIQLRKFVILICTYIASHRADFFYSNKFVC